MSLSFNIIEPYGLIIIVGIVLVASTVLCVKKRKERVRTAAINEDHKVQCLNMSRSEDQGPSTESLVDHHNVTAAIPQPRSNHYHVPPFNPRPVTVDLEVGDYIHDALGNTAENNWVDSTMVITECSCLEAYEC